METMVTRVRTKHGRWGTPQGTTLGQLAQEIASTRWQQLVERVAMQARDAWLNDDNAANTAVDNAMDIAMDTAVDTAVDNAAGDTRRPPRGRDLLPYIVFSGVTSRQDTGHLQQPTGLVLVSIPLPADPQQAALLRAGVQQLPQTVMAFTGCSRRSMKVVVRCMPASGPLPADSTAYLRFLSLAQQQAARYLSAMLGCQVPLVEESLQRGCRMSHDTAVYVNAEAQPLTVLSAEVLASRYPLARTDRQGNCASEPRWDDIERERAGFYACLQRAQDTVDVTPEDPVSIEAFIVELARLCRKSALPEESCVQRTGCYRQWHLTVDDVRRIFRTVYSKRPEGRPWSQMSEKERIARKVRDFFDRRYELRYNVMKRCEEFRPRGISYHPWLTLTERDINRIGQEQMMDCGAAWPIDIKQYAQSSLTKDYNPVHEFLAGCGTWDGRRDYIGELARRVPTHYKEWPALFHRWFLAMVATWLGHSRDHANAVVPMLVGPQGCRKSTFCKMILPHALREYYIDDIKLDNAEQAERMLTRMALVNIDEYNAKTDREQAKIKRILTERDVQVREMRSSAYTMRQRMASFIATTNERQPLTDRTGSRRYLCVEVTGDIDTLTPLNYQQLYAQALYELEHGEPCYLTTDEELLMQQHNEQFLNASAADILLTSYYEPAPRAQQNFVKAVDILADLQQQARGSDRPNMARLVKALKAAHYEYGAYQGVRGWYAKRRE